MWTARTSACVSSDLNVLQIGVWVVAVLKYHPFSIRLSWMDADLKNKKKTWLKKISTSCYSNSKPAFFNHVEWQFKISRICVSALRSSWKEGLVKKCSFTKIMQMHGFESKSDAALPLLPPLFFHAAFCPLHVSCRSQRLWWRCGSLITTESTCMHAQQTHLCSHIRSNFPLSCRGKRKAHWLH